MRRKVIKKNLSTSSHLKSRNRNRRRGKKIKQQMPTLGFLDQQISLKENCQQIGLICTDINKRIGNELVQQKVKIKGLLAQEKIEIEEEVNLNTIKKHLVLTPIEEFTKKKSKMQIQYKIIVEKLFKRHGTNYEKMVKDAKINEWQWNLNQVKKMFQLYKDNFGELGLEEK